MSAWSGQTPVNILRAILNGTDRPARKAKREETSSDAEAEMFAKTEVPNRRRFTSDAAKAAGGICVGSLLVSS